MATEMNNNIDYDSDSQLSKSIVSTLSDNFRLDSI